MLVAATYIDQPSSGLVTETILYADNKATIKLNIRSTAFHGPKVTGGDILVDVRARLRESLSLLKIHNQE